MNETQRNALVHENRIPLEPRGLPPPILSLGRESHPGIAIGWLYLGWSFLLELQKKRETFLMVESPKVLSRPHLLTHLLLALPKKKDVQSSPQSLVLLILQGHRL